MLPTYILARVSFPIGCSFEPRIFRGLGEDCAMAARDVFVNKDEVKESAGARLGGCS